ncbi:MAG: nucleoside triphosphate pyrophosphohydrolase [Candidatus Omnitrophica bacterium]|nr:nucleoside triphosphate pyrophosphohydrolase [Candidatus Omnitrophota bacterium]
MCPNGPWKRSCIGKNSGRRPMKEFDELLRIVEKLRSPQGCPWDREQTVADYRKYLLEETYELIEAIEKDEISMIREEIGDVLLLLVMVCQILKEQDLLRVEEALHSINAKLIARHPHVFAEKKLEDKDAVLAHWIRRKARKKSRTTIRERLPAAAPALLLAELLWKEKAYHEPGCEDTARERELTSRLAEDAAAVSRGKDDAALVRLLETVSELASVRKVSLETAFRDCILRKAESLQYGRAAPSGRNEEKK